MKKMPEKDGRFPEKEDADFHLAITLATHNRSILMSTHPDFHDMLKESIEKYYHKLDEEKLFQATPGDCRGHQRVEIPNLRGKDLSTP